ncbi:MAG: hypothetical protein GXO71_04755 [Caldiserica bacterium]|nr:hypothetical protein [Caldisericota bacterium]
MNSPIRLFITSLLLTTLLIFAGITFTQAAELQKFAGARLVNNLANDGDSFFVEVGGKIHYVRLYFVDCPEISAETASDTRRVKEQARYFGLADPARVTYFGHKAKAFVADKLARPFTVYTAFANAMGRSAKKRIYAFIITAEGDDLASLLVREGLARTRGIGRKTPEGIPREEMTNDEKA